MAQLGLKIISNNYLFHLKLMLILNVFWNELKVLIKIIIVHTQKNIKIIFHVDLPIKLFVLIIDSVKELFSIGEKKCNW